MCDRHLDRLLHLDGEEDIQTAIKVTFEPVGGLVMGSRVSEASALEKVPPFNPGLILIVVISDVDGPASREKLRERPETLVIPFIFIMPKVQNREVYGLKPFVAFDAIVKRFGSRKQPDRVRKACAVEHG